MPWSTTRESGRRRIPKLSKLAREYCFRDIVSRIHRFVVQFIAIVTRNKAELSMF